ncbi:MAG: hypothetical protein Q7T81_01615 [Pseudolabrys sp.]|nr:hypothetical protein [Pseudolabrys sp.]
MNRVQDYIRFAVGFTGVGYIVLWPMTAQDDGVAAMSLVCGPSFTLSDFICAPRVGLPLSPGLHLAGMMSLTCVLVFLTLRLVRRMVQKDAQTPMTLVRRRFARRNAAPPPHRYVRPRTHFGLRNLPY